METKQPGRAREEGAAPSRPGVSRRRYEPPRILFREPLEAMAAVCSPAPPAKQNVAICSQGPISS
jgi:hypothetical protein